MDVVAKQQNNERVTKQKATSFDGRVP